MSKFSESKNIGGDYIELAQLFVCFLSVLLAFCTVSLFLFVFGFVFSVFEVFFFLILRFYFWSLRVLGLPGSCSPCL